MDTSETIVDSPVDESDPLLWFTAEETDDVIAAVAEVRTIHVVPTPRARKVRERFRTPLLTRVKSVDVAVRSQWARLQNRQNVRRLKIGRVHRGVSRWAIRFSVFAVGVAVGVLSASPGNRSKTITNVAPSVVREAPVAHGVTDATAVVAVATSLGRPTPLPASRPAPAPAPPRAASAPAPPPAASAPAPTRAAGHRGTLVVNSQPGGASVFVNGRLAGRTPLVMNAQPVGSRAVRISLDGYAPWSRGVRVVANQSTTVTAKLDRNN